jgi:hypothetical protein
MITLLYPKLIRIVLVAITVTQAGRIVALALRDRSNRLLPW